MLWITQGLGCDGDTVAITAATQPSLEDLVLGAIPGLPKVNLHHPVLAYEQGGERLPGRVSHRPSGASSGPYVLVVEGSIPNEKIKAEGYWAAFGRTTTGNRSRPASGSTSSLPGAWAVVAIGTCAAYGGIHAMAGNPTGAMGLRDYLGRDWKSQAGIPIVNVPGCPVQPDNFMETLLYLLYQVAGRAPMIPLDDRGSPDVAVRPPCTRAAIAAATTSRPISPRSTARPSAS